MARNYIDDGYTIDTKIDADEWHDGLIFCFRPPTQPERVRMIQQVSNTKDQVRGEEVSARQIAERLQGWDLQDNDGNPVDISPEAVLRLEPHLLGTLYKRIVGLEPSPAVDGRERKRDTEGDDAKN